MRFAGTVSLKLTVPVKPFIAATAIVELAELPTVIAPGEVAAIVKSVTANVAVALCERVPLVPVIVRV